MQNNTVLDSMIDLKLSVIFVILYFHLLIIVEQDLIIDPI